MITAALTTPANLGPEAEKLIGGLEVKTIPPTSFSQLSLVPVKHLDSVSNQVLVALSLS